MVNRGIMIMRRVRISDASISINPHAGFTPSACSLRAIQDTLSFLVVGERVVFVQNYRPSVVEMQLLIVVVENVRF